MQFVPTAADLAAAIARLLEEQVGGEVPAHLQHPVRVAAHLARLLEREAQLGPANADRERALLTDVFGAEVDDPQAAVASRIRDDDDPEFERRAWTALVEITRLDLAVAKPGHDSWEGE
jgi:Domain of unknown function (DUF6285)